MGTKTWTSPFSIKHKLNLISMLIGSRNLHCFLKYLDQTFILKLNFTKRGCLNKTKDMSHKCPNVYRMRLECYGTNCNVLDPRKKWKIYQQFKICFQIQLNALDTLSA